METECVSFTKKKTERNIKNLYNEIDKIKLISGFKECINCPMRCKRELYVHWLLFEEISIIASYGAKILELSLKYNNSENVVGYFFSAGLCRFATEYGCGIYEDRPLQCRLNPISIFDNKFILYKECPVITNSLSEMTKSVTKWIPALRELLEPWRKYFNQLTIIIPYIEPEIKNKVFLIGTF